MADSFLVSTTGTENSVVLNDIGGIELIHPTTNLDLYKEAPREEVDNSKDIQDAIDRGAITVTDESGNPITDVSSVGDNFTYYKEDDRLTSTTSNLYQKRLELDYNVTQFGVYKIEWYLEYSQSRRYYPIEVKILFNDKDISVITEDNYDTRSYYFRVIHGFDFVNIDENNASGNIKILYRSLRGRRAVYIKTLKLTLEKIHVHEL